MGYADLIARERMPDRMVDVELAHSQSQKGMGLGFYRAGAGNDAGRGKWDIVGEHMQILSVALAPGEQLESEPGGMMYMSDGVKAEADFSCPGACVRCLGGEKCVLMHYKNAGWKPGFVGITPARPADIVALDLATYGNKISARSGAYLTSIDGATPGCEPELNPLLCCCAGFGCIRQVIEGTGTAFVEASGTVERKALKAGEKLVLDSASLVAYSEAELGVKMVPTWYACCFNGEGMCYTTLTGPGTAWVQSMPWARFKKHMSVTIQLDKDGNVKNVGGPPAAEMARN